MAKRAFWPGFAWRILAHEREEIKKDSPHTGKSIDIDSGISRTSSGYPGIRAQFAGNWEFDELVIDHWFHLEQMNDRHWWIGIGDPGNGDYYHVHVTIDGNKKVTVSVENES
jgi:hypothetical protein